MTAHKLAILGSGGVGKTALTVQMVSSHFVEEYDPTIEDSYRKQVTVDDEVCLLEILDTAGREASVIRQQYMQVPEGFLCMYDITSRASFEEVNSIREQILSAKNMEKVPMVFVGNKSDLESQRKVPKSEGQQYAKEHGCPFFETSAKCRTNVEEAFFELVREMRKVRPAAGGPASQRKHAGHCLLL